MVLHLITLTIFLFEEQNVQNHTYEIFPQPPAKSLPLLPLLSVLFANTSDLLSLPNSHLLNHRTVLHQNISKMVIEWFSTWYARYSASIYRSGDRQMFRVTGLFFTNLMHKFFILIHLLHSSTCFGHYCAHLQEDNCINTASGIVTAF